MSKTQITITRALAEIKTLKDRISDAVAAGMVSVAVDGKSVDSGKPVQEIETILKANLQKSRDLITRREVLKSAIVVSNAKTKVTIGSTEMTVAEAIERKQSIVFQQQLLEAMKVQLMKAQAQVNRTNTEVKDRADQLVTTAVGRDRKVDQAEIDAIVKPFQAKNEASVVDPNKLADVIAQLEAEISEFVLNVDFALSEVNAVTKIDV